MENVGSQFLSLRHFATFICALFGQYGIEVRPDWVAAEDHPPADADRCIG
jgi:hypothetical protein